MIACDAVENRAIGLAISRIARMAMRPAEPGDVEEYERCRALIMDLYAPPAPDYAPNWARDRAKGAAGG